MNTQNLRTLFPTVTKQKILNLSYGEGEHYTVLPMIAKKRIHFICGKFQPCRNRNMNTETEHTKKRRQTGQS